MNKNLEKEQKYSEEQIIKEEENIKKLNEKKIGLKRMDLENQKELLKKKYDYEIKYKKDELFREQENEKQLDVNKKTSNRHIEELLVLLNQQTNTKEKIDEILKENEKLSQIIKDKETEIEIENKKL